MAHKKQLGFLLVTALVMGNMIGSGVFLLPSTLAPFGGYSLVGWGLSAVGAMILAYVFSRLSFHIPQQGGIYAFSRHAFGDYVGFQVAWTYWVQCWIGNAAIVVGTVAYLSSIWPELTTNKVLAIFVSQAILWTVTGVNLLSLRAAGIFQVVSTVLKLIPILLIAGIGIFFINPSNLTAAPLDPTLTSSDIINKIILLTMWSFIGVESAGVPAGSVKNPKKTIPLATMVGTGITALIYMVGMTAILGLIPQTTLAESTAPYALAAGTIFGTTWGPFFHWFVAIGAIISSLGALNGWILIQGQMPLAAAENNLFPKAFGRVNKNDVPVFGVFVSSLLISVLLFFGMQEGLVKAFEFIISLATLGILVCYLFAVVAQMVMIHTGEIKADQVTITDKVLSFVAFCYVLYAMYGAGEALITIGALFFFASTPIYAMVAKQRRNKKSLDDVTKA